MAKKKYLIETSAVPVALGESTPAHGEHFRDAVADGQSYTSVYIRQEFIRRWILYGIKMAFRIDHFQDLPSAMHHLNQEFSIRDVKTQNYLLAEMLRRKGSVHSGRDMAKEFARLAIAQLRKFDRQFSSRTSNSCKCKVGGKELKVDFNHLFDDLRAFRRLFDSVDDCEVNAFLGLSKSGKGARLLEVDGVQRTKAGENLAKLKAGDKWITCTQCARIGDAVIALDQPRSWYLVHIDKDFPILCKATGRQHKQILSERAVDTDVPKID